MLDRALRSSSRKLSPQILSSDGRLRSTTPCLAELPPGYRTASYSKRTSHRSSHRNLNGRVSGCSRREGGNERVTTTLLHMCGMFEAMFEDIGHAYEECSEL